MLIFGHSLSENSFLDVIHTSPRLATPKKMLKEEGGNAGGAGAGGNGGGGAPLEKQKQWILLHQGGR